ncbi:MAG TPA: winged helix-turn-helix domain-containing protein [Acidobacteriaceae bacterium]|jgi:Tol biopolymer transport system component/DNA-binding winged helix-turn-helix (wHTH) protein
MPAPVSNSRLTFGLFEVDLESGELWKAGFRVKLQSQPFKVLAALIERPGQVVTRDELQLRVWGRDTVVDFDHSLGTAINKIREALGDSADSPRYIETLARRGYRFIAPVGTLSEPSPSSTAVPSVSPSDTASTQADLIAPAFINAAPGPPNAMPAPAGTVAGRYPRLALGLFAILLIGALIASYFLGSERASTTPPRITQLTHSGHLAPGIEHMEDLSPAVTDGVHLFAATIDNGHDGLAAVALADGSVTPLNVPDEVAGPALGDISPDGARLLLRDHLSPESEQPLWAVPTIGGSALRIGNVLAHDATWMPNNGGILYANGTNLYLSVITSGTPQLYATLPGRAFWLRWSPDAKLLRFTIIDPLTHTTSLWQLSAADHKPHQLLPGFSQPASECCGVWSADGRSFIFQSARGGNSDLWRLSGESTSDPIRLTNGPLEFRSPVAARTGDRVFFLGVDARSDLQRLDASGNLVPERGFLSSAVRVDYTRDGQWVAWTDSNGQLWRARSNGDEKLQLTPDSLVVFLAHWSPDGKHLALMAREPGKAWQIYLIGSEGDDLRPLLRESRNAADPSWSPDGKSLVFGRVNDMMGKENAERTLHILHLDTNQIDEVPGSNGLFSPRWSPDGRWIAALTLDQRQVRLFDVASHTWTTLPVPSGADPVWTSDSRFLYLHASLDPAQPIDRVSIPDGRVTEVVRLADSRQNDAVDFVFGGLTQQNEPLIRARVFTGNIFSMDLR